MGHLWDESLGEDEFTPIPRLRRYDDGVMETSRVQKALKGWKRVAGVRDLDYGKGDYETLCRSVTMLCELYSGADNAYFNRGVLEACRICRTLKPESSLAPALSATYDIGVLDGDIDVANLVAWCAVCAVKGAESYDCCMLFSSRKALNVITAVFKNFDKLDLKRYTEDSMKKFE